MTKAKRITRWAKKPPGRAAIVNEYDEMLAELKAKPGEWGLISSSPGKQALGREAMRNRGCMVTSQHADGRTEVWAQWVPRADDDDDEDVTSEDESSMTTSSDDG